MPSGVENRNTQAPRSRSLHTYGDGAAALSARGNELRVKGLGLRHVCHARARMAASLFFNVTNMILFFILQKKLRSENAAAAPR